LLNLKTTYAVLSTGLLALILTLSGRILVREYRLAEEERSELYARRARDLIEDAVAQHLSAGNIASIRAAAEEAVRVEGVLVARVSDARGVPLASAVRNGLAAPLEQSVEVRDEEGRLQALAVIGIDTGLVPARAQRMWRLYLTSAALAVSVMMILNLWFVGNLSHYLRHMLVAFRRVDEGDLSVRLQVRSSAEFRRLQDYFNHMLISLEETRDQLRDFAAELSRKNAQLLQEVEVRKQAESSAQQSERKFHAVFDESYQAVLMVAPDGRILQVNQTALNVFGRTLAETVGLDLWSPGVWFGDAEVSDIMRDAFTRVRASSLVRMEMQIPGEGGRSRTLDLSLKPIRGADGAVEMYVCEGYDITSRVEAQKRLKASEAQVRQAQKMDAIGRLAGGIAHDFNNLLTSILGFGNIVLEGLDENHPVRKDMLEVVSSAERAKDLTLKLLTFSRKKAERAEALNLNHVLRSMEKLVKVSLHDEIEFIPGYDEKIGLIEIDPTSMEQIILNLSVNAKAAMPRSGRLYAETRRVSLDEDFCAKWPVLAPGWHVRLTVRDTGYGMSEEVLSRIFEPFFTTKEPGEGTGLGLSTVYGIVQQHKGLITCSSKPGEGTEFQIHFPEMTWAAGEAPAPAAPAAKPAGELPMGTETVLVVEDEDKVCDLSVKVVQSLGYKVITARDGEEGLQVFNDHRGKVDIILTDVVMPMMSGPEMISKIKSVRKDLRYLFVSGFTRDKLEKHLANDRGALVIQKPYTRASLARGIREVLDRPVGK
jgi:two-component system, cell cycle sensor histidine kinase and response regulator CckA